MAKVMRIAAALIQNRGGEVLLVRKQSTRAFMQPGGKIEGNETAVTALCRELDEELNLKIAPDNAIYMGTFQAVAANETDTELEAELFRIPISGGEEALTPQQEIAEIAWVNPRHTGLLPLAPLTRDTVLQLAIRG